MGLSITVMRLFSLILMLKSDMVEVPLEVLILRRSFDRPSKNCGY
jgi:hypothetical protein